jgi:RNA polymerase sigma-70 factor (ECF subfamily)
MVGRDYAPVREPNQLLSFEARVMPHMAAAYNLARWLTRNDHDAEDVVQEAYLRAFRFFDSLRGDDPRAWLLTIVRNTCFTWMEQNRKPTLVLNDNIAESNSSQSNPEELLAANIEASLLRQTLEELPLEFREVIVLRELEGLSYKEISAVTSVPIGTVMSRLARGRGRLQKLLRDRMQKGGTA